MTWRAPLKGGRIALSEIASIRGRFPWANTVAVRTKSGTAVLVKVSAGLWDFEQRVHEQQASVFIERNRAQQFMENLYRSSR